MSITSLSQIISLPEKCPMQEVQGIVDAIYEVKQHAEGKNKQDFYLKDASGARVKGCAWGHDDLSFYKGKEIIIKCGPKGGLTVNNWQGKPGFSVSASCTFQSIAGGSAPTTQAAAQKPANAAQQPASGVSGKTPVHGMTVGMAVNNACESLTATGQPLSKGAIWRTASMIIKVAQQLESGNLYEEAQKAAPPAKKEEEDVPYDEPTEAQTGNTHGQDEPPF